MKNTHSDRKTEHDAVVVGSGPNGLAAAAMLADAGLSVIVFEAAHTLGGGMRSAEITLPGFIHDICSTFHPLAAASPYLTRLPLAEHGLEWIVPLFALGHPLPDGSAAIVEHSIEQTAARLGGDREAYTELMAPLVRQWPQLLPDLLGPLHWPSHPVAMLRFGLRGLRSARSLINSRFYHPPSRALFGGMAAHSMLSLDTPVSAAIGLVLGATAHHVGWPMPCGGSQRLTDALASYLTSRGVEFVTGRYIETLGELPPSRLVMLDITPRQFLRLAGKLLRSAYRSRLAAYRYGPGVFKADWALSGPIPFIAKECCQAGVIHIGGTFEEIAESERLVWLGKHSQRPFIILAQQSIFDPARAPKGQHTAWGYCHVPNGSTVDMTAAIETQIERFAPGFRDLILARHIMNSAAMEEYNPNYIGGDINGGLQDIRQLFSRPTSFVSPYRTPIEGVYLCSSSTPPGGGVHGMCGFHAARNALSSTLKIKT